MVVVGAKREKEVAAEREEVVEGERQLADGEEGGRRLLKIIRKLCPIIKNHL